MDIYGPVLFPNNNDYLRVVAVENALPDGGKSYTFQVMPLKGFTCYPKMLQDTLVKFLSEFSDSIADEHHALEISYQATQKANAVIEKLLKENKAILDYYPNQETVLRRFGNNTYVPTMNGMVAHNPLSFLISFPTNQTMH